jgi:hypothetical protein
MSDQTKKAALATLPSQLDISGDSSSGSSSAQSPPLQDALIQSVSDSVPALEDAFQKLRRRFGKFERVS